jgi:Mg-chelatase subunit ChlD
VTPSSAALDARVVAVVTWLRDHPDVESGPSVRAAMALADLETTWFAVSGQANLLGPALLTLPHRMRVRAGADPDELVRMAVRAAESSAPPEEVDDPPPEPGSRRPPKKPGAGTQLPEPEASPKQVRRPAAPLLSEAMAWRLLGDLLSPGEPWPASHGPSIARPAPRLPGEESLGPVRWRSGATRHLSVRHTLRAAARAGTLNATEWRVLSRLPTVRYDMVLVVDVSASMGDSRAARAVGVARSLGEMIVKSGHRVGMVAFAEEAEVAQRITGHWRRFDPEAYEFGRATNIEVGLDRARRLVREDALAGHRRQIVLVSDAQPNSYTVDPHDPSGAVAGAGAWKTQLLPSGRQSVEPVIHRARRHALMAARRCRAQGVQVSVIIPNDAANGEFARALAAAGRGLVRALGPESPERPGPGEHEEVADTTAPAQGSGTVWQEFGGGVNPPE